MRIVATVLFVLCGCNKPEIVDLPPPPAPHDDAGPPPATVEERAHAQARVQSALEGAACPAGTRRMGAEPPDGHELWCEKNGPDGKAVREGPYQAWYANGAMAVRGAYVGNERDGPWLQWHENGERKQETSYAHGKPHGRFREWDDHGEPLADATYKNGKLVK